VVAAPSAPPEATNATLGVQADSVGSTATRPPIRAAPARVGASSLNLSSVTRMAQPGAP